MSQTHIAIYTRISTVDQADGFGLEAQLDETRRHAERRGWKVVAEFKDIQSGRKGVDERAGLRAALEAAGLRPDRNGEWSPVEPPTYSVLLVREVSRFGRSAIETYRAVTWLHSAGVHVEDVKGQSSRNKLTFSILTGVAEHEADQMRERFAGGQRMAVKNGRYLGGPTPYGYAIDSEKRLVLAEDEIDNVRKLFELAQLPDGSILKTAQEAERLGLVNRDGKPFSKTHISALLRNEIYSGAGMTIRLTQRDDLGNKVGSEPIQIPAPALVSQDDFDAVQAMLTQRRLRYYRTQEKHLYGLAKRIFHIHPDGEVYGTSGATPTNRDERLHRCAGARTKDCPGMSPPDTPIQFRRTSVPAVLLERYVLKLGLDMIEEPEVIQQLVDRSVRERVALEANQPTRKSIKRALARLDEERAKALDQNRKGWMSDDETGAALQDISARRAEYEIELAQLETQLDVESLHERLTRVPEIAPDLWASAVKGYEPPVASAVVPGTAEWNAVRAGLLDEVNGEAPDQDPNELSEWARLWVRHFAETLGLFVVIPPEGYHQAYATLTDPRD